ncbi:hypothetical protein FSP39_000272 [Pinctada imbricata]|uniref:Uncharacterized protein n=1 Tax=Pinctada imbricata TaxID=66713 RepID=A0AA88XMF3_PINIB|nr:hypothetical protein FSP39_000272 [Pinctada imbricata]
MFMKHGNEYMNGFRYIVDFGRGPSCDAQPFPCCTNTSSSTCCLSSYCDVGGQNLTCFNLTFFEFQRADNKSSEFCTYGDVSTQETTTSLNSSFVQTAEGIFNYTVCYTTCPDKTYAEGNRCHRCDDICSNCTGSGTILPTCTCAYGDNGTYCCPKGTEGKKLRNSNSSACIPNNNDNNEGDEETGTQEWVIPVAAGIGGGVFLIVIVIIVYCYCRSRRNGDAAVGRGRTKRPVSQLLQVRINSFNERLGLSKKKRHDTSHTELVTLPSNLSQSSVQGQQPVYENVDAPDPRSIAAHALLQLDKTFRYIKDPTLPREKSKDQFKDRPVTGMYQNESTIRLQQNKEREEINTLGVAPPIPKTSSSTKKKKSLKLPKLPKSSSKKHKKQKANHQSVSDESESEDYIDMSGGNKMDESENPGVENEGFTSEIYANYESNKYNTAPAQFDALNEEQCPNNDETEGPSEDYENIQLHVDDDEPIYENRNLSTL